MPKTKIIEPENEFHSLYICPKCGEHNTKIEYQHEYKYKDNNNLFLLFILIRR